MNIDRALEVLDEFESYDGNSNQAFIQFFELRQILEALREPEECPPHEVLLDAYAKGVEDGKPDTIPIPRSVAEGILKDSITYPEYQSIRSEYAKALKTALGEQEAE